MPTTDPKAIRALAHPLRLDLLELLVAISPATAAHCGRILGVSQASCSFHLRQLAKYGFVEDAGPGADKRERRWRIVDRHVAVSTVGLDPAVAQQFSKVWAAREAEHIQTYIDRRLTESEDWRAGAGGMSTTLPMSAEESATLKQQWKDLLAPFEARAAQQGYLVEPGQRYVRYFMAATPFPTDFHLGDSDESAD